MTTEKLRSVLEQLESEAEALLNEHGIHLFLSYGWEDHDTPDTEHLGIYFWQMHAPYTPQFSWPGRPAADGPPTEQQILLYGSGQDFIGTLDFARRSIGRALCYASIADPEDVLQDNREFWQEYATALQWLYIASDRLRHFFAITNQLNPKRMEKKAYSSGFEAIAEAATPDGQQKDLAALADLAKKIEAARDERNKIVHEIATRAAQQDLAFARYRSNQDDCTAQNRSIATERNEQLIQILLGKSLDSATEEMKNWYLTLIQASNLVFQMEYFTRNEGARAIPIQ